MTISLLSPPDANGACQAVRERAADKVANKRLEASINLSAFRTWTVVVREQDGKPVTRFVVRNRESVKEIGLL
jgi:hypothetical protein